MKTFREVILEFNKWRDTPFKRKDTIGSYPRVVAQQPDFEYYIIHNDEGKQIETKGQTYFKIDEVFNYWLIKVFNLQPNYDPFEDKEDYRNKRKEYEQYMRYYLP
jgi:hypothetical protein